MPADPGVKPGNGVVVLPPMGGPDVGIIISVSGVQVGVALGGGMRVRVVTTAGVGVSETVGVGESARSGVVVFVGVHVAEGVNVGGSVGRPSAIAVRSASDSEASGVGSGAALRQLASITAMASPTARIIVARFIIVIVIACG